MNSTVPGPAEFVPLFTQFDVIPLVRSFACETPDPVLLYQSIRKNGEGFLLESGKGGRYTLAGTGSVRRFSSRDGRHSIEQGEHTVEAEGDLFGFLREQVFCESCYSHPDLPGFQGGGVGYFSYDVARYIERLPDLAEDDLHLPDAFFLFPDSFFRIDHVHGKVDLVCLIRTDSDAPEEHYRRGERCLDQMEAVLENAVAASRREHEIAPASVDDVPNDENFRANISPEDFSCAVERAIQYILAGDIFQVNLSVRFAREYAGDPLLLYKTLRRINPSPYMTFLECDDHAIVGASPELLLKVSGQQMVTRPIAGTRKRGADEEEDAAKARELIENEKERAEHVMLVDMERNDLGRVARYGTVHVDEFMGIEKYSHVMHIVSNVRGELRDGHDLFDAIPAVFPGGTITGAPKVRAMEIIEELEPTRRGIYTGSVGWIGYNGDAELNISIRTMIVKDGIAYAQAGAGIVADSVPAYEYKESLRKAEAALKALRQTTGVL